MNCYRCTSDWTKISENPTSTDGLCDQHKRQLLEKQDSTFMRRKYCFVMNYIKEHNPELYYEILDAQDKNGLLGGRGGPNNYFKEKP